MGESYSDCRELGDRFMFCFWVVEGGKGDRLLFILRYNNYVIFDIKTIHIFIDTMRYLINGISKPEQGYGLAQR